MFVYSRRKGESLMIGHDITLVVVEVRGDKVRLGVDVPADVMVVRSEVFQSDPRNIPAPPINSPPGDDMLHG